MTNYSKTKEIQGFIIKEQPYKGSQKLFKVFTQQGIISVISGSRIASNIHLFSEVKLLVSAGYGDLYFLKEWDVLFQLEAKYKDICLASFLSELYQTTSMTPEEWPYYAYLYKIALGFFKQEEWWLSVSIQGSPGFIIEKEKRADSHNSILSYNQRFHLFFWPFLQLEGHMLDWKTETNQLIIKEQAIQLPSKLISFMHTWTISDFSPELFFQLSDIQIETLNRISKIVIQKYFPKNKSIHTL